jgi:hypothetical protein
MTRKELRDYLGDLLEKREQEIAAFNQKNRQSNLMGGLSPGLGAITDDIASVEIRLTVLREIVAFLTVQNRTEAQKESDKRNGGVRRGMYASKKKAS